MLNWIIAIDGLIHARLKKVQIDNQQEDWVFLVVFILVTPPRSIATGCIAPRSWKSAQSIQLLGQQTNNESVQLLVQESHFRVDMSLINSLGSLFMENWIFSLPNGVRL